MAEKNPLEQVMNTTDLTSQYSASDIAEGKLMSVLSYLWILFFLPLVVCPQTEKTGKAGPQPLPRPCLKVTYKRSA